MTDSIAWRICLFCVLFSVVALVVMLAPWLHYYLGPEVSFYDVGAPQLRAMI